MKKSFLLAAALLVLGGSTMVAKTAAITEQPALEAKAETVKIKYVFEIYDNETEELLHIEAGCYGDDEIEDYIDALLDAFGGVDVVSALIRNLGEC